VTKVRIDGTNRGFFRLDAGVPAATDGGMLFAWKKLASAKWEDAWMERLSVIDPTRLSVTSLPGRKSIRLEAWSLSKSEAASLVKQFGGQVRPLKPGPPVIKAPPRAPIRIRESLLIVSSEREKKSAAKLAGGRRILLVPAAMAFGTGEHATTSCCLRFLSDAADSLRGGPWEMLDLGTGSGILAIAARKLGAKKVEACDFDPHAVRTALENVRANAADTVSVKKLDVLKWTPKKTWDVVAANLFSEVLIAAAPAIARAVKPAGRLIFSGILRSQEKETVAAFLLQKFRIDTITRKGKWVTVLATKK
jgi:ribosomal protein L11 methyltransferase